VTGGRLIAVVGPSGVGKDSVMGGITAALPDIGAVRRVITRDPELGGENFDAVSEAAFAEAVARGDFCLHWRAHGLRYGIPARVLDEVRAGGTRLANLSRGVLTAAAATFPALTVLHVTASPRVLAARLAGRGREPAEEVARRLERARLPLPDGLEVVELCNDGALSDTVARAVAALQPVRA
jgi:ribose 1,5-bisphosphokinase